MAFWDSEHSVYVNARHRDVHYRMIAEQIASFLHSPSTTIFDYGCGEALYADHIAAAAVRLILVEAAPSVPAKLAALAVFRRLLRDNGLLLIGDVVPPHISMVSDALALLRFAAANGFLWAAVRGLVRTGLSDYRQLRSRLGLSR